MAPHTWVFIDDRGGLNVPNNAIRGGEDVEGSTIYVGRASHEGDLIPAKVIPGRGYAYVSYCGKEYRETRCEVLCGDKRDFKWIPSKLGKIEQNAVIGGETADGETLYIGRFHQASSLTVGKVHPSHETCYIAWNHGEVNIKHYEILVKVK